MASIHSKLSSYGQGLEVPYGNKKKLVREVN